jgi:hypothetical protein
MALCVKGHVGQFAAAQFEHKVINTGLAIVTSAAVVYASNELDLDSGAFVDVFLHYIIVLAHLSCAGLAGVARYVKLHWTRCRHNLTPWTRCLQTVH